MTNCTGRYAEAWQYAAFWCISSIVVGAHDGPGPADVSLSDSTVNFVNLGAVAGKGQIVYNLTQSTDGKIIGVTNHTLEVDGVTWNLDDQYRATFLSTSERSQVEHNLDIVAGDIHAALASVGACDCALSTWGANYLAEINIILARLMYDCPCQSNLSDRQREVMGEAVADRLNKIIDGTVDVCQGATGSKYPVIGWASVGFTEQAQEQIVINDALKNDG